LRRICGGEVFPQRGSAEGKLRPRLAAVFFLIGIGRRHALQIFRGLLLPAAIAVLAIPIVTFFGISQAVASFEFAALVPLVRSFAHLGTVQMQRDYDYRPVALALTASNVAGLAVAALAAATILPDHRVIILAFLVDAAVYAAASHSLAHAPMRVIPDRETLRQALAYGLPLMLNGVGLALVSQADRMVVGRFFGMDILGVYAVTLSLAVAPISPLCAIWKPISGCLVLRVPRLRLC
jgi:O-antigen/teichoic acid export membrane protein